MQVVIESAGDHRFDLNHLRQEGAGELLEQALRKANYNDCLWRVQVQKKVTCNAETRPLAVVGFKPWCCYVKLKPGDNNSAHFCTVLMPPGFRGEDVFRALKAVEDQIDRNWRFQYLKKTRPLNGSLAGPEIDGAVGSTSPLSPGGPLVCGRGVGGDGEQAEERLDLTAWLKDPEKTRLTLLAVHEVARGPVAGQAEFVAALAEEMGWHGVSGYAVVNALNSLLRRGYLNKLVQEGRHVGWELTGPGRELIDDLLPPLPPSTPPPPPVRLSFDPGDMLQTLNTLAQEYTEAVRKLRENRERRAELMAEVEKLDAEARDLHRKVNNPAVQLLVRRVVPSADGQR